MSANIQKCKDVRGLTSARRIIQVYEPQMDADTYKTFDSDFIEAAAIFSLDDAPQYQQLRNKLKTRGVPIGDWERRVRKRELEIWRARKEAQETQLGRQKANDRKSDCAPAWEPLESTCQQPVDGHLLLQEVRDAIRKFVRLEETEAVVVALWILFTWVFERAAETNPFLRIVAATKSCGKSTLLKVLLHLTRSGWLVASTTKSSFTRKMQTGRFTMLLDEGDAFLRENEGMRNLLDAASDPDTATCSLSVKQGDNWISTDINVFVPIAIASINLLRGMDTVESRSIAIWLRRTTSAERQALTKARNRVLKATLAPITDRCSRWAHDNAGNLVGMRPNFDLDDGRDEDKWEPLIAIADYLDAELGKRVRAIAAHMTKQAAQDRPPLTILLLADIKKLFDRKREQNPPDDKYADTFASETLCSQLAWLDERPWSEFGRARLAINQNQLARHLKDFQIAPRCVRIGPGKEDVKRGYQRKDFEDAWLRYPLDEEVVAEDGEVEKAEQRLDDGEVDLAREKGKKQPSSARPDDLDHPHHSENPHFDDLNRYTVTTIGRKGQTHSFQGVTEQACNSSQNGSRPLGEKDCNVVTVQNPKNGEKAENELTDAQRDLKARLQASRESLDGSAEA